VVWTFILILAEEGSYHNIHIQQKSGEFDAEDFSIENEKINTCSVRSKEEITDFPIAHLETDKTGTSSYFILKKKIYTF
jgi:hypothetical protein